MVHEFSPLSSSFFPLKTCAQVLNRLKLSAHVSLACTEEKGEQYIRINRCHGETRTKYDNKIFGPLEAVWPLHALSNDPQMTSSGSTFKSLITFVTS
jgi:hypothetical protein